MARHADAANALFADFHIERVPWSRLDIANPAGSTLRQRWITIDSDP
jgi:prepilin-type processing-associated H-X9-DG protein